MFDIGFWELAFIGLLALVVLGPKRLPEAARTAGQWVGKLRRFITNVKQDLNQQLATDELAELRKLKAELAKARDALQESSREVVNSIANSNPDNQPETGQAEELDFIDRAVTADEGDDQHADYHAAQEAADKKRLNDPYNAELDPFVAPAPKPADTGSSTGAKTAKKARAARNKAAGKKIAKKNTKKSPGGKDAS